MLQGHLHPLTQVEREIVSIFGSLGFKVVEGPEIESQWYNFEALNFPKDHPARDMQATLTLKDSDKILRTHTSAAQVAYMEKNQPPIRIIVPGKVYRRDASDASHTPQFRQVEGLMVDKNVNMAQLKGVLAEFIAKFFGPKTKIRWRPAYFPFVEPGMEVDICCNLCQGKGCPACKKSGWMELLGAGMVHPNVFKAAGYQPDKWQGFAFGMGVDRIVMMKYGINDIRLLYNSDLRFLKQF